MTAHLSSSQNPFTCETKHLLVRTSTKLWSRVKDEKVEVTLHALCTLALSKVWSVRLSSQTSHETEGTKCSYSSATRGHGWSATRSGRCSSQKCYSGRSGPSVNLDVVTYQQSNSDPERIASHFTELWDGRNHVLDDLFRFLTWTG
jgi:hypothetical protein